MKLLFTGMMTLIVILTGCTTFNNKITPQYVNPSAYQNMHCNQLQAEVNRITNLVEQTQKQQVGLTTTGIGIGLTGNQYGIYPTISLGMGTSNTQKSSKNSTLAKLYGEHDAMIIAGRQKSCAFVKNIKIYGE